jgi:hypothetical protein
MVLSPVYAGQTEFGLQLFQDIDPSDGGFYKEKSWAFAVFK